MAASIDINILASVLGMPFSSSLLSTRWDNFFSCSQVGGQEFSILGVWSPGPGPIQVVFSMVVSDRPDIWNTGGSVFMNSYREPLLMVRFDTQARHPQRPFLWTWRNTSKTHSHVNKVSKCHWLVWISFHQIGIFSNSFWAMKIIKVSFSCCMPKVWLGAWARQV